MDSLSNKNETNLDFSAGFYWILFSVLLVIAPVFLPYAFTLLQGKTIDMTKDALDISLLVYSVSCGLLFLCLESKKIKKTLRKINKIISCTFFAFSVCFYIHVDSSDKLPDNINVFIYIGLLFIVYTIVMGYIIANKENH